MSMPQYIHVAVVASNSKRLRDFTKSARISEPGVAPRYSLVSLKEPSGKRVLGWSELDCNNVLLWIALDDVAKAVCDEQHQKNLANPRYSRGFYDIHLPLPVIKVTSKLEFEKKVREIDEAFYATS